ncbi:hypothetical protein EI427_23115 [Flammeovirga pectinis]|uniref:Cytochrome c domain-containing protein n=1 Tax=Flammeovirga pectinis TaxID=2494373 RepID=A0A3S9PAB6_9BACT|nr:hypothetical protein [Flammeovirga pectinis]AZQ65109.1 hypothetical protein EI427_23115 [Flammeovirga pectinis]
MKKVFIFTFISLLIFGCSEAVIDDDNTGTNDNDVIEVPEDDDDAVAEEAVVYDPHVLTIADNYCISCHSGSSLQAGINLSGYTNFKFQTESGNLLSRINNSSNPMPPAGLMPQEERQRIQKWVDDNFPEK